MTPQIHAHAYSEAFTTLVADGHVLIAAAPGLGRTRLARDVARAYASAHDRTLVRVSVPAGTTTSALRDILPGDLRDAELSPHDLADALAQEIGASAVLVVDDAHRLIDDDARALEVLLRRPRQRPSAVLTMTDAPGRAPILRRMRRDGVAALVTLHPLDRPATEAFAQSLVQPDHLVAEAAAHVWEQCGGVPLLITDYVEALHKRHSAISPGGAIVWDRTAVRVSHAAELGDMLGAEMSSGGLGALRAVAAFTTLSVSDATALTSSAGVAEARDSGFIASSGLGRHEMLTIAPPFAATCLAVRLTDDALGELVDNMCRIVQNEQRPLTAWTDTQLHGLVSVSYRMGRTLPLPITRRAWLTARLSSDHDLRLALTSAVIDHPEASVDDRLAAIGDRIANTRAINDDDRALNDIAIGVQLIDGASVEARAEFQISRSRMLLIRADHPLEGISILEAEADSIIGDDAASVRARSRLRLERLSELAFAGEHRAAYADLSPLFADSMVHDEYLHSVGAYVFISAQRGMVKEPQATLSRYFGRALAVSSDYPWLTTELVGAGFFLDIITGRITTAARTVRRLDGVLMKIASLRLPPGDPSMMQAARAMVSLGQGSWSTAKEEYEAALAGFSHGDSFGFSAHVRAGHALALAADGEAEAARDAVQDVREGATGVSLIVRPWTEVALLLAELWTGRDITDDAMALADSARSAELGLIELRALHLAALSLGGQTPAAIVHRAQRVTNGMTAPIASPLATHVTELATGMPRLEGTGARLLARHGVFVPSRGVPSELTARERQVAMAAALGYSAKAIAAQFGNSKRTIDAHLNRIYVKLGVSGREDLADALDAARE